MENQEITSASGVELSKFAFGTMQFGGKADAAASQAMYETCRAAGLTHFDTANAYTDGMSETLLGQFAASERDDVIIATKCGYIGGASAANIRDHFDGSRKRLGMEMVDILYLHRFDPDTDLAETLETFAQLRDKGQIRFVGLSNFAAWQVMKAQAVAAQFDLRIHILQPMYNLLKRQAEVEILPMCADQDIAVAPYSPLAGGLLTGKYASGGTGRIAEDDRYAARYGQDWMHSAAQSLHALAADVDCEPATLAVAWAAAHPTAPMPIISARSTAQLAPSLAALDFVMTPELYDRIAALTPTPPPATDRLEEQS